MPLVANVDYVAKRIYLSVDSVGVPLDTLEVYKEVRTLRRNNESHRQFKPMILAGGNIEKIPGVSYTPIYVQLLYGCRIVPFDAIQLLKLVRDTFTDDGQAGRDIFDRSGLTSQIDIDVDFPAVEVRVVDSSGSGGSSTAPTVSQIWAMPKGAVTPGSIGESVVLSETAARIAAAQLQS